MNDFFLVVFPWVAMGIAVALVGTNINKKRKSKGNTQNTADSDTENKETYMSEGLAIGLCLGCALGTTGIIDIGTGLCIGMLLGLAIGTCIKKQK